MTAEVIILGADDSCWDCPFDAELWSTGEMLPDIDPDCTKVFLFNPCDEIGREKALKHNITIISPEVFPDLTKRFKLAYLRTTASYMIAYALYHNYEKIKIYGVDREGHNNADQSRLTWWLGIAKGMGVKYEIAKSSRMYRVLRDNIRDNYARNKERIADQIDDFVNVVESGRDPFCFVSGVDADDVTVITKGHIIGGGEEVVKWYSPSSS